MYSARRVVRRNPATDLPQVKRKCESPHSARVHNSGMSHEAEPTVPPDKRALRRQLRGQRRFLLSQRDRVADGAAIAAAAGALLDTLSPSPSGNRASVAACWARDGPDAL
jgi:hypothetical protein